MRDRMRAERLSAKKPGPKEKRRAHMDRQSSYTRTRERLEEIVTQVKAKDMPLEKSLDLYEEALRLGSVCAEMIDRTDFSAEELEGVGALEAADEDANRGEGDVGNADDADKDDGDEDGGDALSTVGEDPAMEKDN
jgi:exodeoxyribonuclease VII small subunit